jgi:prevent-host-death family protein
MEISVSQFKAKCLKIIESVEKGGETVIVTRHGRAAAQLIPVGDSQGATLFGRSRNRTQIHGDLLSTGDSWDAEE